MCTCDVCFSRVRVCVYVYACIYLNAIITRPTFVREFIIAIIPPSPLAFSSRCLLFFFSPSFVFISSALFYFLTNTRFYIVFNIYIYIYTHANASWTFSFNSLLFVFSFSSFFYFFLFSFFSLFSPVYFRLLLFVLNAFPDSFSPP